MKLTTKGRYAVTAMIDLALHSKIGRVALTDIAERQNLSLPYLEQLFASLRKAGLVNAVRGPKGGYTLSQLDKDISLADILLAVDEKIVFTCGEGNNCNESDPCLTHQLWNNLSQEFFQFLNAKKLSELSRTKHVQSMATEQDVRNIGNIPIRVN